MRVHRRIAALVAACGAAVALCALPAAAATPTGGPNNVVLVQTTADGSALARASTQVVTAAGDTVTSANIATATASDCTGCHSTAVAVQVLLVTRNPSFFGPGNAAVATNAACTGCGSFAYARQF